MFVAGSIPCIFNEGNKSTHNPDAPKLESSL